MAARRPSIDLLSKEDFTQRAIGRLLLWILTVGRYIVIFTELIVIAGFITRVFLDRNLTKVNEDLFDQKTLLASYEPVENRLRHLDQQFEHFTNIQNQQIEAGSTIENLSKITPINVQFELLSMDKNSIELRATSLSAESFAAFLAKFQTNTDFENVSLDSVKTGGPQDPSLKFVLSADFKQRTPFEKQTTKQINEEEIL